MPAPQTRSKLGVFWILTVLALASLLVMSWLYRLPWNWTG